MQMTDVWIASAEYDGKPAMGTSREAREERRRRHMAMKEVQSFLSRKGLRAEQIYKASPSPDHAKAQAEEYAAKLRKALLSYGGEVPVKVRTRASTLGRF